MERYRLRARKSTAKQGKNKPRKVVTRVLPDPARAETAESATNAVTLSTLAQTNSSLIQQLSEKTDLLIQTEKRYIKHLENCHVLKLENEQLRKENTDLKARLEPLVQLNDGSFLWLCVQSLIN